MGKKSGPSPPDPVKTADAQAAANADAIRAAAEVNQIREVTPFGEVSFSGEIGAPDRTRTTTLPGPVQEALANEQQIGAGLSGFGVQQLPRVAEQLSTPFSLEGLPQAPQADSAARDRVESALFGRLEPQIARDEEALRTRLANQGIAPGSRAFQVSMDDLNRGKTDARLGVTAQGGQELQRQVGLQDLARQRGISETLLQRSQPLNELSAALTGAPALQQPQVGQVGQFSPMPVDIAGQINRNFQTQSANNQANLGGLYGLGSAALLGFL